MSTAKSIYQGQLSTRLTHVKSGTEISTDAPTDNQGKGESFSPTDLVASALASCMLTIMGIKARDMEVSIEGTTADITKIMASNPRRIERVEVLVKMPKSSYSDKQKKILENAALTCPVAKSLSADLVQDVKFEWL